MVHRRILIGMCALFTGIFLFMGDSVAEDLTFVDEYLNPEITKTVSMDFQGATLGNVLKILSQQSEMNFVATDKIADKRINVYLDNVGVWEALEHILEANSLTYEMKPGTNIFMVKELVTPAKALITRVYQLKHATVPSHLLNNTLTFDDSIGSSSGGEESGGEGAAATPAGGGDSEEGIIAAISSVLSEDGSVVEDKRTNSLIVSDYATQFTLIELTIARLDVRVPQILIEAEMLDVAKSTTDLLGAKFSGDIVNFQAGAKTGLFPFDDKDHQAVDVGANEYAPSTLSFEGFNFIVQFLRTHSDTRNLARPRILTLNNQTATIAIKTDEAVGLQQETSGEGTSVTTEEAERTETGVFLKVTPYANVLTQEITMAIEPKVVEARTNPTFPQFRDPEERGTKSILRIMDGDTIIIGGLLRTNITDVKTNVPVLGSIPIMGAAFRHKDKREDQRELIVFITPHILEEHLSSSHRASAEKEEFVREQDAPDRARWAQVNEDLQLNERYD